MKQFLNIFLVFIISLALFISSGVFYPPAQAQSADTTPPSVPTGLTAAVISFYQIDLTWSPSSDNVGVASYRIYVNGIQWAFTTKTPPPTNLSLLQLKADTAYTLTVSAIDAAGNASAQSAPVSVKTLPISPTPPAVTITSPQNGASVVGNIEIKMQASGGTCEVHLLIDNVLMAIFNVNAYPYGTISFIWGTFLYADGPRTLTAKAYKTCNASDTPGIHNITVTVANSSGDTIPPTLTIHAPQNGATLSGTVSFTYSATDNVVVDIVELYLNDVLLTSSGSGVYTSFRLDTRTRPNGSYIVLAKAYDRAGNVGTKSITVTISNIPDTTPPSVPANVATNFETTTTGVSRIQIAWSPATDNVAVTGYKIYRGGALLATNTGNPPPNGYYDKNITPLTTYSYTISAADGVGNESAQSLPATITTPAFSGTPPPTNLTNITFTPKLQGRTDLTGVSFTIQIFNSGQTTELAKFTVTGGTGSLPSTVTLTPGIYDIRSTSPYYLSQKATMSLTSSQTFTLPTLLAGDLSNDNIINSLDWSLMSPKWFTSDPIADLNKDGSVNSIDFSLLNRNWGRSGA